MEPQDGSVRDVRSFFVRHPTPLLHTLDDAQLEARCPLDNGMHLVLPNTPIGDINRLPLELINQVLGRLDIPTLTTFRRVNQRAMHLVDSLPSYRRIWTTCPDILRAAVSLNANSFSCDTIFKTLIREKCEFCGEFFGGYLYLITCTRICHVCHWGLEHSPVEPSTAIRHFQELKMDYLVEKLKTLPQVHSLPGCYGPGRRRIVSEDRKTLIDRMAIMNLTKEDCGYAYPLANEPDDCPENPRRNMAIISAPYLSRQGQTSEWGLFCSLCANYLPFFEIKYRAQDMVPHFERWHVEDSDAPWYMFYPEAVMRWSNYSPAGRVY